MKDMMEKFNTCGLQILFTFYLPSPGKRFSTQIPILLSRYKVKDFIEMEEFIYSTNPSEKRQSAN